MHLLAAGRTGVLETTTWELGERENKKSKPLSDFETTKHKVQSKKQMTEYICG